MSLYGIMTSFDSRDMLPRCLLAVLFDAFRKTGSTNNGIAFPWCKQAVKESKT